MWTSLFKGLSVFEGVEEADLLEIEAVLEERTLISNEVVFRKEDSCDGLYFVQSGGVVVRNEAIGRPIERAIDVGPGDLFGEIEAISGAPRMFVARALGPTTLYRLPQANLMVFLKRNPPVETRLRTLAIHRRTVRLHALLDRSTRKEPRIRVDRRVVLTFVEGERVSAHLEDLSNCGACLSAAPAEWHPGQLFRCTLGTTELPELLPTEGVVRWRYGDLVGVEFDGGVAYGRAVARALRELLRASD